MTAGHSTRLACTQPSSTDSNTAVNLIGAVAMRARIDRLRGELFN
jgi:hypothetical protein